MQATRIYMMPQCKMVSSGVGMFGQEKFDRFDRWLTSQTRGLFPRDYLFFDAAGGGFHWLYTYSEGMDVPEEFDIIDFPGGLYAVSTDIDGKTDVERMKTEVDEFLAASNLERDPSRCELGNIITPPEAQAALGYSQMDYFVPVKIK